MEIVFIAITKTEGGVAYAGARDAIQAAEARSGCRVWCITDGDIPCQNRLPLKGYWASANKLCHAIPRAVRDKWAAQSIYRWLVLLDFAKQTGSLVWPILPLDYDVLVFGNIGKAFEPYKDMDFCGPNFGAGTSAAYHVGNLRCLQDCASRIWKLAPQIEHFNDMALWTNLMQSGQWKMGDLTEEHDDTAFDMNIHSGDGLYEVEPTLGSIWGPATKKITWQNGCPYFTRIADKGLVRAHWIHCWGSYKQRTKELLQKAGL